MPTQEKSLKICQTKNCCSMQAWGPARQIRKPMFNVSKRGRGTFSPTTRQSGQSNFWVQELYICKPKTLSNSLRFPGVFKLVFRFINGLIIEALIYLFYCSFGTSQESIQLNLAVCSHRFKWLYLGEFWSPSPFILTSSLTGLEPNSSNIVNLRVLLGLFTGEWAVQKSLKLTWIERLLQETKNGAPQGTFRSVVRSWRSAWRINQALLSRHFSISSTAGVDSLLE